MSSDDLTTPGGLVVQGASLTWRFARSGGAGGQHVNTTDSKAALTCDLAESGLPAHVVERLVARHGAMVTVVASTHRSQWRNRRDALDRLAAIVDGATVTSRPRRPTRPSRGAREARLQDKRQASQRKSQRRWRPGDD